MLAHSVGQEEPNASFSALLEQLIRADPGADYRAAAPRRRFPL